METYNPFHEDLDNYLPIAGLLSKENIDMITGGGVKFLTWVSIFRNSPASNAEAEGIMGMILTQSVRAGQWVDIPLVPDEASFVDLSEYDPNFLPDEEVSRIGLTLEYERGAGLLANAGFIEFIEDSNGGIWLSPTRKLLDFYKERLKQYGPEE